METYLVGEDLGQLSEGVPMEYVPCEDLKIGGASSENHLWSSKVGLSNSEYFSFSFWLR